VRITRTSTSHFSHHLRQVEELLDPIRYDRSIDDAERRRQISDVLATANARALSLRATREQAPAAVMPSDADLLTWPRWHRGLARTG
jgi:hypothetical protein